MAGGYMALFQQQAITGVLASQNVLAGFFLPGLIFFLTGSNRSKAILTITGFLVLSQSIIYLALGSRFYAIAPLVAYAWIWHRCIRPLPLKWGIVSALVLLIFIIPTTAVIRTTTLGERSSIESLLTGYSSVNNPAVVSIAEMGGTLQTIALTIELVPSIRPFDYGLQYIYSTFTVLPNIFWNIHPTIAHGTPAAWLVQTVDPFTAAAGGGLGYSFIAEAYLNLGFWGAPLVLLVIGFLFTRFVIWASWSDDPAKFAAIAVFLASFMFFTRQDSTGVIRPLVWYSLLPYITSLLLPNRRERQS